MNLKERIISHLRNPDGESEDVDYLLSPGNVERLVAEGRAPVCIGRIGSPGKAMQPYYQVPPRGEFVDSYQSIGGCLVYISADGSQKIGNTYTLTVEQAQEVEQRVLLSTDL